MNTAELKRALSRKPNSKTRHPEVTPTMSEAVLGLTDLAHIKQTPAIAKIKYGSVQQASYIAHRGHYFKNLEDALRYGNNTTWKLAEYYVDNDGLFLLHMPSNRELATVAQRHLETIPDYIDDEEAARDIYARELIEEYSLAVKVTGDYALYFDYGDTADYVEGHIDGKGRQITTIVKLSHEHCLRRATYRKDAKTMTITYYR